MLSGPSGPPGKRSHHDAQNSTIERLDCTMVLGNVERCTVRVWIFCFIFSRCNFLLIICLQTYQYYIFPLSYSPTSKDTMKSSPPHSQSLLLPHANPTVSSHRVRGLSESNITSSAIGHFTRSHPCSLPKKHHLIERFFIESTSIIPVPRC